MARVARAFRMIGLLGGTFDPIHYGHLRPAQEIAHTLGLAEVRLIPARQPPHRPAPHASAQHRLQMAQLASQEFPGFSVDDRELRREGPSYTVDTLESLRAELGTRPLCWLMGADAFRGIETWREWERLPELAHLVVMQRPGAELNVAALPDWARLRVTTAPDDLNRLVAGRILFQAVTPQDISATRVRAAIANHEPVQACLPAPVWKFIKTHHIYINSET